MKQILTFALLTTVSILAVRAQANMYGSEYNCSTPGIKGNSPLYLTSAGYLNLDGKDYFIASTDQARVSKEKIVYVPEDTGAGVMAILVDRAVAHPETDMEQIQLDGVINVTDVNEGQIGVIYEAASSTTVKYDCVNKYPHQK